MAMQNVPIFGENPLFGVTQQQLCGEKRNTRPVRCKVCFECLEECFHIFFNTTVADFFFAKHSLAEEYRSDKGGGGGW